MNRKGLLSQNSYANGHSRISDIIIKETKRGYNTLQKIDITTFQAYAILEPETKHSFTI